MKKHFMTYSVHCLRYTIIPFLFSLPCAESVADDIEIYNSSRALPYPPYEQTGDIAPPNPNYPNVLFVLDASLSMIKVDGGYTNSRLSRLQEAMTTVLNSASRVNVGIMRFSHRNSGGRIIYPMSPIEHAREGAIETVNSLSLDYWTPTIGAMLESAYYFGGKPVYYGKTRFSEASDRHRNNHLTRVSHPDSYTGGIVKRNPLCTDGDLDHPSCESERIDGNAVYRSPILSPCQKNYQVIITDGGATGQVNRQSAQNLMNRRCSRNGANTCGVELSEFLATQDQSDQNPGINTVATYTVGFNTRLDPLKKIAAAGGGRYFESDSAEELVNSLTAVLNDAAIPPVTFSPPTITVDPESLTSNRNDIYLALFEPQIRPLWPGNLKGYWFNGKLMDYDSPRKMVLQPGKSAITGDAKSQWSEVPDGNIVAEGGAASQISPHRERWVVTNHPQGSSLLLHDSNLITLDTVTPHDLKLPDKLYRLDNTDASLLVDWVNGRDVHDSNENGDTSDDRQQYGDPLHSNPIIVTYGKTSDQYDSVVYFGTNDGFLHAINTQSGKDIYSFMPWELIGNIKHGFVNMPYVNKLYGMDGQLSLWQHDNDKNGYIEAPGDHAYLYAGMRRGGNNYYALNVTDKDSPELMWSITGGHGEFKELGQTWSKMVHGKMVHPDTGEVTDVMVFGGGYDTQHDKLTTRRNDRRGRALYIVDARTGELVWSASKRIDSTLHLNSMSFSIPATPAVIDVNGDGIFDQIYVGDMGGQLWRFDFSASKTPSGGVIAKLSTDQTAVRFFATPDVALVTSHDRGDNYLAISLGSGTRSQPLSNEPNVFYVIKQEVFNGPPAGYGHKPNNYQDYQPLERNQLVDITNNKVIEGNDDERAEIEYRLGTKHGWYLHMEHRGEKVLNPSITVDSKVIFTSYVPGKQTECLIDPGSNNLYALSLLDGTPAFDWNEDGKDEKSDRSIKLETPGISAPPNIIFTENNGVVDVNVLVGTESTSLGSLKLIRRTHWTEMPEF